MSVPLVDFLFTFFSTDTCFAINYIIILVITWYYLAHTYEMSAHVGKTFGYNSNKYDKNSLICKAFFAN